MEMIRKQITGKRLPGLGIEIGEEMLCHAEGITRDLNGTDSNLDRTLTGWI